MEPSKWQHVISEPNPADYASRGIKASETKKLEKWNNGADFVCKGEEEWLPQPLEASEELLDIDKGVKREKRKDNSWSSCRAEGFFELAV